MSEWPPSDQAWYPILRRTPASSIGTMQYSAIDNGNLETDLDMNHIDNGEITYRDVVIPDGLQKNPQSPSTMMKQHLLLQEKDEPGRRPDVAWKNCNYKRYSVSCTMKRIF